MDSTVSRNTNIFDQNFEKGKIGPRYNKDGEIVKYTLLGSPEVYEKYKKKNEPIKVNSQDMLLFSLIAKNMLQPKADN